MAYIIFPGDYITRVGSNEWIEVEDTDGFMTCFLSDGSTVRADEEHISNIKSKLEFAKWLNNFGSII